MKQDRDRTRWLCDKVISFYLGLILSTQQFNIYLFILELQHSKVLHELISSYN